MVVVSHLFLFLGDNFRGRCDSYESHLPLFRDYLFPDSPVFQPMAVNKLISPQMHRKPTNLLFKVNSSELSFSIHGIWYFHQTPRQSV